MGVNRIRKQEAESSVGGRRLLLLLGERRVVVGGHSNIALGALLAKVERHASAAIVERLNAGGAILVGLVATRLALAQIELVAIREHLPCVVGVTDAGTLSVRGRAIRKEIFQDGVL